MARLPNLYGFTTQHNTAKHNTAQQNQNTAKQSTAQHNTTTSTNQPEAQIRLTIQPLPWPATGTTQPGAYAAF